MKPKLFFSHFVAMLQNLLIDSVLRVATRVATWVIFYENNRHLPEKAANLRPLTSFSILFLLHKMTLYPFLVVHFYQINREIFLF